MSTENDFPETLMQAVRYFAIPENAFAFVKQMKFPDGVVRCPKCSSTENSFLKTRSLWKCKECKKQFSVKVGTIFEDSALGFDKWLPAFWMIVNAKNGISSCELARAIGVTQKSAWHMLHRILLAVQEETTEKMKGHIEVDETYIGAKAAAMNRKTRRNKPKGTGMVGKTIVQGLLERTTRDTVSRVKLKVARNAKRESLMPRCARTSCPAQRSTPTPFPPTSVLRTPTPTT